jgi:hypothetical protein
VEDEVGALERLRTGDRDLPRAARQMRVGDDRDEGAHRISITVRLLQIVQDAWTEQVVKRG